MADETSDTTQLEPPPDDAAVATDAPANESGNDDAKVKLPEYAPLAPSHGESGDPSIKRFYDVNVTISAELGRVTLPIGDLLQLGEGAVVELNRSVNSPIDLMAQGVLIARGEVVVVDDCFAVRIREIEPAARKDK